MDAEESMAHIQPSAPIEKPNTKTKPFQALKCHLRTKLSEEDPPMTSKKSLNLSSPRKTHSKLSLSSNTVYLISKINSRAKFSAIQPQLLIATCQTSLLSYPPQQRMSLSLREL